jgi:alginate O-acetyltransferase complex protein AlgI
MVFSSLVFLYLFLPVVLGGYFLLPRPARNAWLLAASLLFYFWGEGAYIGILLLTIVFNWAMGLALERRGGSPAAKVVLAAGIAGNLILLVYFKYADFLIGALGAALPYLGGPRLSPLHVHLPIGISFFTFQAISYLVDISRREIQAQRNPVNYAMYKAFFPQLIAGPIVRYRDVAAAVVSRVVTCADFAAGVSRFIIGLGKKVLIANIVAEPADQIFSLPGDQLTAGLAWFGAVCYALQIYFDFSGYSDMAIGMGRMFGFRFLENFQYPYAAVSVRDFWRRWNISLSSWFRDYLYIPLGGSRGGDWRTAANLLAVFALCGLWHGAGWTFLIWGLFHGVFLTAEHFGLGALLQRIWRPARHAYAMVVVLIGWVLFRCDDIGSAERYFSAMFGATTARSADYGMVANGEVILAMIAGAVGSTPYLLGAVAKMADWSASYVIVRILALAVILFTSTMVLTASAYNPFIYFRF